MSDVKYKKGDPHPTRPGWRWISNCFKSPKAFEDEVQREHERARLSGCILKGRVRADGAVAYRGRFRPPGSPRYNDYVKRHGVPVYTGWTPGAAQTPVTQPAAFDFAPGNHAVGRETEGRVKVSARAATEARRHHNKMQAALYSSLLTEYGADNVSVEQRTSTGTSFDLIARRAPGSFDLFEIKTSRSDRECIREAVGQLLEYAYWSNSQATFRFVVVGPAVLTAQGEAYLTALRERHQLDIQYRQGAGWVGDEPVDS